MTTPNTKMTPNTNAKATPAPAPSTPMESAIAVAAEKADRTKNQWKLDATNLVCTYPDGRIKSFNILEVVPDFVSYTEPHKAVICNGISQKLGDSCARKKTEKLTIDNAMVQMGITWERIVDGSAWTRKGGVGGVGLAKQLVEKAKLLTQDERDTMNSYFAQMGMTQRV